MVRLPIARARRLTYGVYVTLAPEEYPDADSVLQFGAEWIDAYVDEPLVDYLLDVIETGRVVVSVEAADEVGEPPLIAIPGTGSEEHRRRRDATHLVWLTTDLALEDPPLGVLADLALARGVAEALEGVILDAEVPCVRPIAGTTERLSGLALGHHVVCPVSWSDARGGWCTTLGMRRFGLPNLELRGMAQDMGRPALLVTAVAQHLVERALGAVRLHPDATSFEVPDEVTVDPACLGRAYEKTPPTSGSSVTVALRWTSEGRGELQPFVEIVPPRSFGGAPRDFARVAQATLLG
jgi:hypothetical protein